MHLPPGLYIFRVIELIEEAFDAREELGVGELAFLDDFEGCGVGFGGDVREIEEGEEA